MFSNIFCWVWWHTVVFRLELQVPVPVLVKVEDRGHLPGLSVVEGIEEEERSHHWVMATVPQLIVVEGIEE